MFPNSRFRAGDPYNEFIDGVRIRMAHIRRLVTDLPIFTARRHRTYQARLAEHRRQLPVLDDADATLVRDLAADYVASRPVELDGDTQRAAHRAIAWLDANAAEQPATYLPLTLAADYVELFVWGLSAHNLDIAEHHVGLPVRYLGMEVKAEHPRPAAEPKSARNWHADVEDRRMLKIVVYLSDVDEQTGPFEYISAAHSDLVRSRMRWRTGFTFLYDRELAAVVPESEWRRVTGPAATAIYVDTGRLIHRIRQPRRHTRYSVTYVYSSDRPFHTVSRFMPPTPVLRSLKAGLTPRQRRALAGG